MLPLSCTVVASLLLATDPATPVTPPRFDHVLLVSIDGLHAKAMAPPIIDSLPTLARLLRGPHTLDARTDSDVTVTLPNHVAMMTGLAAAEHGWLRNDDPPGMRHGGTIHERVGRYLPSAFDVAHDHGVSTAIFTGKTKFWLFEQSYGAAKGAPDVVGDDHGKAKIDLFVFAESSDLLVDQVVARLVKAAADGRRTLDLVHFADPDLAGHAHEWDLTPGSAYVESLAQVDRRLGRILQTIDSNRSLQSRTAIVITTDHGGGAPTKNHTDFEAACNFTIPFVVWLGADREPADLYALNAKSRARPSATENPGVDVEPGPIRNGDLGNLGLLLLGLPSIEGSRFGGATPLVVDSKAPLEPAAPSGSQPDGDKAKAEADRPIATPPATTPPEPSTPATVRRVRTGVR